MFRTLRALGACILLMMPATVQAAGEQPTAVDLLFSTRHLDLIDKGNEATYKFERTSSDEKAAGQAFTDEIKVRITDVNEQNGRDIRVTVFTGDRERPIQEYDGLSINPAFVWYLDRAVDGFRSLAGGSVPYLKDAFKRAIVEKATLEPAKVEYNGKSYEGYTVTVVPYANDRNVAKMEGFENSKFTITVSKDVPGYFVTMTSHFESTITGTPKVEERINFVNVGAVK